MKAGFHRGPPDPEFRLVPTAEDFAPASDRVANLVLALTIAPLIVPSVILTGQGIGNLFPAITQPQTRLRISR
jgi:hypothetical protein